jgi:glutamine amidotransferase-like uncharacterized protein
MTRSNKKSALLTKILLGIGLSLVLPVCSESLDRNPAGSHQGFAVGPEANPAGVKSRPILLFDGTGASLNDVAAIEAILNKNHLEYVRVNSQQLDAMNQSQMQTHRLLVFPGGNFVEMGNGLQVRTTATIRRAVNAGLNYLGICGGAFIAGNSPYNGMNLTDGLSFNFYSLEASGVRKASVAITAAGLPTLDYYWEDGPELSGWGETVATYPDGNPAVSEGFVGDGWVVLVGVHPEAPESWRRGMTFATPASASNAYAMTLIDAALNRKRLAVQ